MLEVTQEDRDAIKSILWVSTVIDDQDAILQAFAAHRIAAEKALLDRLRDLPEQIAVMVSDRVILAMDVHEDDPRLSQICDEVRTALADAIGGTDK